MPPSGFFDPRSQFSSHVELRAHTWTDYHLLPGRKKQMASELETESAKPAEIRAGDSPRPARAIFDGISAPNLVKVRKNKIFRGAPPRTPDSTRHPLLTPSYAFQNAVRNR